MAYEYALGATSISSLQRMTSGLRAMRMISPRPTAPKKKSLSRLQAGTSLSSTKTKKTTQKTVGPRVGRTITLQKVATKKSAIDRFKEKPFEQQVRYLMFLYQRRKASEVKPYEDAAPEAASEALARNAKENFQKLLSFRNWQIKEPGKRSAVDFKYEDHLMLLPLDKQTEVMLHHMKAGRSKVVEHFAKYAAEAANIASRNLQPTQTEAQAAAAAMDTAKAVITETVAQELGPDAVVTMEEESGFRFPELPVWGWVGIGVGGVALIGLTGWMIARR